MKILPHHEYRRSEIWRQNYTKFLVRINTNYAKKNGLRIHHLHPIFNKILWETLNLWPYCMKIKNTLLGFIWSSKAEVKILPHQVYRSFEGKNYTSLWRRNQHEFCKKKLAQNAPFASNFQKCFGGVPGPPPAGGVSTPAPFPKRRFAPICWLPPSPAVDPLDPPMLEVRM